MPHANDGHPRLVPGTAPCISLAQSERRLRQHARVSICCGHAVHRRCLWHPPCRRRPHYRLHQLWPQILIPAPLPIMPRTTYAQAMHAHPQRAFTLLDVTDPLVHQPRLCSRVAHIGRDADLLYLDGDRATQASAGSGGHWSTRATAPRCYHCFCSQLPLPLPSYRSYGRHAFKLATSRF